MMNIPKKEQEKLESMLDGQARSFGLNSQEYLRKIWYHEQASKLGEYTAMVLVNDLIELIPTNTVSNDEESQSKEL